MTQPKAYVLADIRECLEVFNRHATDRGPTTVDTDEDGIVTIYDRHGAPAMQMEQAVYEDLWRRFNNRIRFRGPLGNLRPVDT